MSLDSWPLACPACQCDQFTEIGRIETNDFGADDPPNDCAVYRCADCDHEWIHPEQAAPDA